MYRIQGYILMVMLLFGLISILEAQTEADRDSIRFYPLKDSILNLHRAGQLNESLVLAESLLREASAVNNHFYMIQAHRLLIYIKDRSPGSSAFSFYENAMACYKLSMEYEEYESAIICIGNIALAHFNASEYDSAKAYYKQSMELSRDYLPHRYPLAISNMAFINGVIDNRDEELEYYLLALKVSEEHPEYDRAIEVRANAYSGIGDYYRSIKNFDKAVEYYQAKLKLGEEHNLTKKKYEAMYGLAKTYEHLDFYDFKESEQYYQLVVQDTASAMRPYRYRSAMGLAELYIKEERYEQSQELLLEARQYYKRNGSSDYVSNAEELLALGYYKLRDYQVARKWTEQAIESTRKNGLISRERKALNTLYRIDSVEGRYKEAFINFQRFQQINDSLNSIKSTDRLNELQVQYETEQATSQNERLQASLDLEEVNSQRKNTVILAVGTISFLLIVSIVVVYRNYNRKKRDHDTIASQAAELRQLSDFKEGLTGMVVHDMKNPINSIIGFSRGTPDEKKMKKINQSGYNILNLVTNMLDIQRFEEARVEVITESVETHRLVANAGNEVHLLLQAKSLRFKNRVPKGVLLKAEKALLDRVMVNLLTNAIKYSQSGAEVTVALGKQDNGFQEIIVQDSGDGISPEKLPFVFDKFWHKDARKSGLAPSTGLGLSFCKLAVEAHGGSIRVQSEPSVGTSMTFTIPLSEEGVTSHANSLMTDENDSGSTLKLPDLDMLKDYLPELKLLKVYQVSAINKIINELEQREVNPNWVLALQAAVYQGDQTKYDELLSEGLTDEAV